MTPDINQFLNRTVMVSIPRLFDDGFCRPYTLLGVEVSGLWLRSDELTDRLLSETMRGLAETAPIVFVPFAQIAGVLAPTQSPETLTTSLTLRRATVAGAAPRRRARAAK